MKRRSLYRLLSLLLLSLLPLFSMAQDDQNPVRWSSSVEADSAGVYRLVFTADIQLPWHMYDLGPYDGGPNPTTFTFTENPAVELLGEVKPLHEPTRIFDSMFEMEIGYFMGQVQFVRSVRLKNPDEGTTLHVNVEWMACDDQSCLPPADQDFTLVLGNPTSTATTAPTLSDASFNAPSLSTTDAVGSGKSLWGLILEAILWGLAALLTPCVFPMVPLTVSFFLKGSDNKARGRMMASMYGLFIVLLYTLPITLIILITKLVGGDSVTADIFNWLATHWLPNVIFFLVFMIFAASFFGAFEITMPSWMVNRSDRKADQGGIFGTFFMALTLVLVSFSCTGPIVGSVLIKSTSGEVWTPVITMLAFSLAFALPFTLFAFFPTLLKNLPKSGGWLNSVKIVLGFLELALGLKFLSVADQTYHWGLLDREIYLALWIVIFALLGFYLLGKIRFAHDSEPKPLSVTRLLLSIGVFAFVVYLIPGMWGAPLKGISGYLPPMHTQDFVYTSYAAPSTTATSANGTPKTAKYSDFLHLPHGLSGFFDFNEALEYARQTGKPLFVDYTGHGCVNCREMEARVWSDPRVLELLRDKFVVVALYSDDKKTLPESEWVTTDNGKVLKSLGKINAYLAHKRFGVNSQPYYLILNGSGEPIAPGRGYDLDIAGFVQFLETGLNNYAANPGK